MPNTPANKDKIATLSGKCPCKKLSAKCYNFVVVGATGAGKTTLIDSLVNYLLGVEFYDNFRYKLIDERGQ
jgi:GTPase SAR1 family protein